MDFPAFHTCCHMGFADPFFNLLVFLQNFLGLYFPEDHCPVCPGEGIKVLSFIRVYTCSSFTEFTQYCGIWLKITLIHFLPYVLLSQFCKSQPHGPSCFSPHGRIPAIPLSPHEAVASSQLLLSLYLFHPCPSRSQMKPSLLSQGCQTLHWLF